MLAEYVDLIIQWWRAPLYITPTLTASSAERAHAWLMVFAIVLCLPISSLIARYFKVTRKQNWPIVLDSKFWWYSHLLLGYGGMTLALVAVALFWSDLKILDGDRIKRLGAPQLLHFAIGWATLLVGIFLVVSGWFRGSKGGPNDKQLRGDHYDLTPKRLRFESIHKYAAYGFLVLSLFAAGFGVITAGLPRWSLLMFALGVLGLCALAIRWELKGRNIPSYQATFGLKQEHPGNRRRYPRDKRF
jgi:hypothetical protein